MIIDWTREEKVATTPIYPTTQPSSRRRNLAKEWVGGRGRVFPSPSSAGHLGAAEEQESGRGQPGPEKAQLGAESSSSQTGASVPGKIQHVWSKLEFAGPWTEARIQSFKNNLVVHETKNDAKLKPLAAMQRCSVQETKKEPNETCFLRYIKKSKGNFPTAGNRCTECERLDDTCIRITPSAVAGKDWLVTLRS